MNYREATQEDLERIDEGACQVLEGIGVRIKHKGTVYTLVGTGAKRISTAIRMRFSSKRRSDSSDFQTN